MQPFNHVIPWLAGPPPPNNPDISINGVPLRAWHLAGSTRAASAVSFTLGSLSPGTGSESSRNSGLSCNYGDTIPTLAG